MEFLAYKTWAREPATEEAVSRYYLVEEAQLELPKPRSGILTFPTRCRELKPSYLLADAQDIRCLSSSDLAHQPRPGHCF